MRLVAVSLSACFALTTLPLRAQEQPAALSIVVVEGEGAINNVRQRTARETIVQVEDENHKPVAGAVVTFTLPSQGAGGTFAGGAQTLSVVSNAQGRAIATGLKVNRVGGNWTMRVNASFGGHTATAAVAQTNAVAAAAAGGAAAGAAISTKVIVIVAVAAGVAAGGAVAATHAGGGSSSNNNSGNIAAGPTTITLGGGTVGAPHKLP